MPMSSPQMTRMLGLRASAMSALLSCLPRRATARRRDFVLIGEPPRVGPAPQEPAEGALAKPAIDSRIEVICGERQGDTDRLGENHVPVARSPHRVEGAAERPLGAIGVEELLREEKSKG